MIHSLNSFQVAMQTEGTMQLVSSKCWIIILIEYRRYLGQP